jgi:hypothetical protein
MKTDELITLLANNAAPVAPEAARYRFSTALGWGLFATALAMALTLGVRPDITEVMLHPMFWVKLMFPALMAALTLYSVVRLARPGMRLGAAPAALVAPVAAVWLLALISLGQAAPAERSELVFGSTWLFCVLTIPLLSIPVFLALLWALKGFAPTRPSLTGGAAGLLAGSASAAIYALHCPELGAPFIAIWYLLGMVIPAAMGALIGARLLRW